nr:hypothetical protein [Streptacidiphilus anmyonensis]
MPFEPDDVRINLMCGKGADGHWFGCFSVCVRGDALRPLGLHPEQPTSQVTGPSPPRWWHAAAERQVRSARWRPKNRN